MRRIIYGYLAVLALAGAALAAFDPEAQSILDQGRWGLVGGEMAASDITAGRACTGTSIIFSFSAAEIQRIKFENGQPPAGPPDFYADVKLEKDAAGTKLSLFAAKGDATPVVVYAYDADAKTLRRADADTVEFYALCAA